MTQEEVMQIMTDMGLHEGGMANWVADNAWWTFANVVAQHEREACAKVCEDAPEPDGADLAERIRARGQA
jgi:hypothetical protein